MTEGQDIEQVDRSFTILDFGKAQCLARVLGGGFDIVGAVAQRLDIIEAALDVGIGVQHGGTVIGEGNAAVGFRRINTRRGQPAIEQRSGEPDAEGEGERCRIDQIAEIVGRAGNTAGQ